MDTERAASDDTEAGEAGEGAGVDEEVVGGAARGAEVLLEAVRVQAQERHRVVVVCGVAAVAHAPHKEVAHKPRARAPPQRRAPVPLEPSLRPRTPSKEVHCASSIALRGSSCGALPEGCAGLVVAVEGCCERLPRAVLAQGTRLARQGGRSGRERGVRGRREQRRHAPERVVRALVCACTCGPHCCHACS